MFRPLTRRRTALAGTALALVLGLTACDPGSTSSSDKESQSRDSTYDQLVAGQPAHSMNYSPTRDTINQWIDTWGKKGAVSYVYLQGGDGKLLGYFVLKGLPVSYCVGLTPPEQKTQVDLGDANGDALVPAPSVDGAYYSGADCNSYYGFTADSGTYVQFTVGQSQNVLLYNQPLPQAVNVPNLAPTP